MRVLYSILLFIISFNGFSQDRAPSLWLKYQDNFQGDILINTIRVQSPSPLYTYYCTLQWNSGQEGGGYCGIQEHPDGRNFIFSLWDSNVSSDPVTTSYTHSGTQVESFGGEGTGLKSWNFDIGWNTDQWYSFVTRVWDENSHTLFGYWVFNHSSEEWYHLVTMDYPVVNVRFSSTTGSFLEDWLGNGFNTREVHHKEGWKRKTSDLSWDSFNSSLFERVSPDAGAANYIDNYDGGTVNEYYFMKSGGSVTPVTNTSPSNLSLINNNSDHGFPTVEISTLNKTISSNLMTLNWDTNVSKSPQFSYHVEIYDNSEFSGTPVIQLTNNVPHSRSADIDISSLVEGNEYYIRFYIIDIFDNQSTFVYESFFYNDADGDGVIDDIDNCPSTPIGEAVDANGCSDSQKDTDGDGINDDVDNCPTVANGPSTEGTTVAGGNSSGSAANQLSFPRGIALDASGNMYIVDTGNDRVQKQEAGASEGTTVAGGNGDGSAANKLSNPAGIALDASGNLYIADTENHRIQKWAPGASEGITVAGGNGNGSSANKLSFPRGIALDVSGNMYIGDRANNRVQKWEAGASKGTTVAGGNGDGSAANKLSNPRYIALDASGNMYIGDTGNNRIQKWTLGQLDSDDDGEGDVCDTDDDGDGVSDDVDICPDTPNGETVDAYGCSDSQLDTDEDGVTDDIDQCPDTPNGETVDANGCSDSQVDTDEDGITDDIDQCPSTPTGEMVDVEGCPLPLFVENISFVKNVYPNPTDNELIVELKNNQKVEKVEFIDFSGKIITPNKVVKTQNRLDINVSNLHNGIYLLNITTDKEVNKVKVVIER